MGTATDRLVVLIRPYEPRSYLLIRCGPSMVSLTTAFSSTGGSGDMDIGDKRSAREPGRCRVLPTPCGGALAAEGKLGWSLVFTRDARGKGVRRGEEEGFP